jgi:hypothetical protein
MRIAAHHCERFDRRGIGFMHLSQCARKFDLKFDLLGEGETQL